MFKKFHMEFCMVLKHAVKKFEMISMRIDQVFRLRNDIDYSETHSRHNTEFFHVENAK